RRKRLAAAEVEAGRPVGKIGDPHEGIIAKKGRRAQISRARPAVALFPRVPECWHMPSIRSFLALLVVLASPSIAQTKSRLAHSDPVYETSITDLQAAMNAG